MALIHTALEMEGGFQMFGVLFALISPTRTAYVATVISHSRWFIHWSVISLCVWCSSILRVCSVSLSTHQCVLHVPSGREQWLMGGLYQFSPSAESESILCHFFFSSSSAKLPAPRMEFSFSRGTAAWHNVFVLRMSLLPLRAGLWVCACEGERDREPMLEAMDMADWL